MSLLPPLTLLGLGGFVPFPVLNIVGFKGFTPRFPIFFSSFVVVVWKNDNGDGEGSGGRGGEKERRKKRGKRGKPI